MNSLTVCLYGSSKRRVDIRSEFRYSLVPNRRPTPHVWSEFRYSLVPNRRPTPHQLIFQNFSNPPSPLTIKFWEKFHLTQAFKIYTRFVEMKIKKILLENQISVKFRGIFQPLPAPFIATPL